MRLRDYFILPAIEHSYVDNDLIHRYLKQVLLPDLHDRGLIEKVHTKRPPNETEQRASDAKKRKSTKRNAERVEKGHSPIETKFEDMVSEWLWRRKKGAEEKWGEEEMSVEKLEDKYRVSYHWPDGKTRGMQDPYTSPKPHHN